jgi:hypothetical protein
VLGLSVAAAKLLHWDKERSLQIQKIAQTIGIA